MKVAGELHQRLALICIYNHVHPSSRSRFFSFFLVAWTAVQHYLGGDGEEIHFSFCSQQNGKVSWLDLSLIICSYTILLTDPSFIPSCISGGISFWTSFSFNQSLRFCKLYAPGPGVWGSLPLNLEDYKVGTSGNIRHWTYMGQKVEKANNL